MTENPQPTPPEKQPSPASMRTQAPASTTSVKPASSSETPGTPQPASSSTASTTPSPTMQSFTAKDTHEQDLLGMGRTAGQRTAEVFAGLRAELMRTPEAMALTRLGGRITARLIISMGSKKALNFVPVRYGSFVGLIRQALGTDAAGKVWVEVAAGFSPRGIILAKQMPDLQVIEIDLPDVIEEKQKRLEKADITVPPNLHWLSADLGVEPLSAILDQQQVDVISAEGLLPYFEHEDITCIARQFSQSLKPGGVFVADLGFNSSDGMNETNNLVRIFRRYTSSTPGAVADEATAFSLFQDAGYAKVDLYRMPQTATMFDLPQPVSDVTFFMVAQRGS